jgi:hypothetical protein
MRRCAGCGGPNETRRGRCRACKAAWARANRPRHSELSPIARAKANARAYTQVLLKRGELVKEPCRCGETNVEAHHPDYSQPRLVIWLCRACHRALHRREKGRAA